MQFTGALGQLDADYLERRELSTLIDSLHAEIFRLRAAPDSRDVVESFKAQIRKHAVQLSAVNARIDRQRLAISGHGGCI